MKRASVVLLLILAFCGLSDSIYLAENEANNVPLLCNSEDILSGCNIVAASDYSYFFGISIAEYGVIFYAFLFVVIALELALQNRFLRRVIQVTTLAGVVVSAYLTYIELFVIKALCIYCIASAVIVAIMFIVACYIEPVRSVFKKFGELPRIPILH